MRMNFFRPFFWASLSVLLLGFPLLAKAGDMKGSPGKSKASVILVDDHRGGHHDRDDRGRWGHGWQRGDRDWDDRGRWGRNHRRDSDDYYYGRRYYYRPYGYGYGYPYYYNYSPYGYAYPYSYSYPYYRPRSSFFLRIW